MTSSVHGAPELEFSPHGRVASKSSLVIDRVVDMNDWGSAGGDNYARASRHPLEA